MGQTEFEKIQTPTGGYKKLRMVADGGSSLSLILQRAVAIKSEIANKNKMVSAAAAAQAYKFLKQNPQLVKMANKAVFGMLTPPKSGQKIRYRPYVATRNRGGQRGARRRLNFNPRTKVDRTRSLIQRFSGRGSGGRSRGGTGKSSRSNRKTGGNFFEAKEFVRFEKGTKANVKKNMAYHLNGYVDTKELTGQVSDPNCVYIGHCAQANEQTMFCLMRALIRKLLRKTVKFDGVNAEFEIPGYLFDDTGTVYKIVLLQKNLDTDAITVLNTWNSSGNNTISQIAQHFISNFIDYSNGYATYSSNYKLELFKFQVYIKMVM